MRRPALAALVLLLLLVPMAHGQGSGGFLETFDGQPAVPAPYPSSPRLDALVHSRDRSTWRGLEPMTVGHGADCEAPPATHQSANPMPYADAVFKCRDHLMTAIHAGGYGVVYLTPGAMADFTDGETVIRFDMSTLRTASRDWMDLWVTPFDDAMAAPLGGGLPDLSGVPRRGLHFEMATFDGKTGFRGGRIDNHQGTDLDSRYWLGYESAFAPSAARRDTFELRISKTHIKLWMPQYGITWVDKELDAPLDWTRGVVQIGHHSYTPEKDCTVANTPGPDGTCRANTWHFDNLSISRTAQLAMIPAVERFADPGSPTYTFPRPAPTGAYLQVHALATSMEYSLDDGATWADLGKQASVTHHWGGKRTYWQPIPAGTTRVTLRGIEETGPWDANHAVLLSEQAQQQPPTPTPPAVTPTATPTNTPVPTTETPVPTATSTPTATATGVPPTATPFPKATATGCTVTVSRQGTPIAQWECE